MLRSLRHLLIVALLALHGSVSACGPGAHLVASALAAAAGPETRDSTASVRADHSCPICEWHWLGHLPGLPTDRADAPAPRPLVVVARRDPAPARRTGPARPRSPPSPRI